MRYSVSMRMSVLYKLLPVCFIACFGLGHCVAGDLNRPAIQPLAGILSAYAPAAVEFNGKLFLGWRGQSSIGGTVDDQQLYLSKLSQEQWTTPVKLPGKSMVGPVLARSDD